MKGEKEYLIIGEYALKQDRSADYGVYSTSCFDLDEFLDENGRIPVEWDYESDEYIYYSGRFAYDNELSLVGIDLGLEGLYPTELMFTADTHDDTTDVLRKKHVITYTESSTRYDADGNVIEGTEADPEEVETSTRIVYEYNFNVGNFSVSVMYADNEGEGLTQEEVQDLIDNIRLTNGLER